MLLTAPIRKTFLKHLAGWLVALLFLAFNVYQSYDPNEEAAWLEPLLVVLLLWVSIIAASYLSLFLHTYFFKRGKYVQYGITFIAGAVSVAMVFRFAGEFMLDTGFVQTAITDVISFSLVMALALGVHYAKRGIVDQYRLQKTEALLLKSELETLKTQLNPHFLFNTLNNIYGTNLSDPEKGSEMILHLAELYRYFLDIQKKERVSLKEELAFIYHYVELEKLRLTENNHIHFHTDIDNPKTTIAPLLLMPLIENAIKYGCFPGARSEVDIQLRCEGKSLHLSTKNSFKPGRKVVSSGNGLSNLKRRLSILYPDRFTLQSEPSDKVWVSNLRITL
jgi:sensor histidine kinase YesM